MFFSISIPVYNAEQYLDTCLKSIVNQTEKDYEIILVNDGSTDNSLKICNNWYSKYPELIRVIDKPNTGSLLTRRVCLNESNGEYLLVMDADDYLFTEDALSIIRKAIESSKCDMVFFESTSGNIHQNTKYPFAANTVFGDNELEALRKYVIIGDGFNPLWNKVFHKSLVDWDFNYLDYSEVTNGTDMFQMLPIFSRARKILYIDRVLYFYRTEHNESSIVHKFRPTIYLSLKENFLRLKYFSECWEIPEKEKLLRTRCMKFVSTAAYKARLITQKDAISRVEYLRAIGEDSLLSDYFTLRGLPLSRCIIILLLRLKLYNLLSLLLIRNYN